MGSSSKGRKLDPQKSFGGLNGGGCLSTGQSRNFNQNEEMIFCVEAWEDSVVEMTSDASFTNIEDITNFSKGQRLYVALKSITVTSGKIVYYLV